MKYFKEILAYALPYKGYGLLNMLCNIFYALFSTLSLIALFPMLNVLFGQTERIQTPPQWQGLSKGKDYVFGNLSYYITQMEDTEPGSALTFVIAIIILSFLLKNLFGYLATYFMTFLRNGVLKDLRNEGYQKILDQPLAYFSEKRKGDTMSRIATDISIIQASFLSLMEMLIREPLSIAFAIFAMLSISLKLTLFVFIFIPISGFLISRIGKKLKKQSLNVQQEQGFFMSILDETLGGLKVIKGFTAEKIFTEKFQESTARFYNYSNRLMNRQHLASPTSEFLGIAVIAVILWFGGRMVFIHHELEAAEFLVFMVLTYQILTPAKAISKASYSVKSANAAAERVLEILQRPSPLQDDPDAQHKSSFTSGIAMQNISFKYEEEIVLKTFSLAIPKGKTVALVGQSGSGKSTIANLLTRFYDVNQGSIKIDGLDIRALKKSSLRALMGLVTQDSILFNDTIKNNLLIGKKGASDQEIRDALKVANAWEFVKALPKGIDTSIGDSGNKLSGGQKQRIAIARAVLKNPPIMILDEATSALDTESEKLVQSALENMMRNRTSIVIAHRLSTIQNADLIVVMKKGSIVESGKHHELIAKNGNYKKLVDLQSFEDPKTVISKK